MIASEEPIVAVPVDSEPAGAWNSRPIIETTRRWITSVCGYSSSSIRFLASVSPASTVGLRLHPARHERGEVERRVAVEVQLVVHELVGGVGAHALRGQAVLGDVV